MNVNLIFNYFLKILVFLILILIQVNCKKFEDECDISLESASGSIKWKLDPSGPRCDLRRWRVTLEGRGGVDINVTKVSIEAYNSFFLLGPGLEPDLFLQDVNIPIIIISQKVLRFIILEQNQFSILLRISTMTGSKGEFELTYGPYYTPDPLTSSTTTPKPPPSNPSDSAVLYVNNTSPKELRENRFGHQLDLATIANMYVDANKYMNISRNLTYDDIYLWWINPCNPGWPNWDRCAAVNVSIEGFQAKQVMEAWSQFGNQVMNNSVYKVPDDLNYIWLWVGISTAVILLIITIFCVCQQTPLLNYLQIKRDNNRGVSLISSRSSHASQDSWFPTLSRGREYSEDRRSFSNGHQWVSADLQVLTEDNNADLPPAISQNNKNFSLLSSNPIVGAGAMFYSINDPVYDFPDEDEKDA